MGIPKHLIQLLKGLYGDQSAVIRTEFGDTDRFKIKKGVRQGCILSPFFLNLYAERIMRKAEMEEAKEEVKIAGKTLNNLRYADDTTLMAGKKTDLTKLIRRLKRESEKAGRGVQYVHWVMHKCIMVKVGGKIHRKYVKSW